MNATMDLGLLALVGTPITAHMVTGAISAARPLSFGAKVGWGVAIGAAVIAIGITASSRRGPEGRLERLRRRLGTLEGQATASEAAGDPERASAYRAWAKDMESRARRAAETLSTVSTLDPIEQEALEYESEGAFDQATAELVEDPETRAMRAAHAKAATAEIARLRAKAKAHRATPYGVGEAQMLERRAQDMELALAAEFETHAEERRAHAAAVEARRRAREAASETSAQCRQQAQALRAAGRAEEAAALEYEATSLKIKRAKQAVPKATKEEIRIRAEALAADLQAAAEAKRRLRDLEYRHGMALDEAERLKARAEALEVSGRGPEAADKRAQAASIEAAEGESRYAEQEEVCELQRQAAEHMNRAVVEALTIYREPMIEKLARAGEFRDLSKDEIGDAVQSAFESLVRTNVEESELLSGGKVETFLMKEARRLMRQQGQIFRNVSKKKAGEGLGVRVVPMATRIDEESGEPIEIETGPAAEYVGGPHALAASAHRAKDPYSELMEREIQHAKKEHFDAVMVLQDAGLDDAEITALSLSKPSEEVDPETGKPKNPYGGWHPAGEDEEGRPIYHTQAEIASMLGLLKEDGSPAQAQVSKLLKSARMKIERAEVGGLLKGLRDWERDIELLQRQAHCPSEIARRERLREWLTPEQRRAMDPIHQLEERGIEVDKRIAVVRQAAALERLKAQKKSKSKKQLQAALNRIFWEEQDRIKKIEQEGRRGADIGRYRDPYVSAEEEITQAVARPEVACGPEEIALRDLHNQTQAELAALRIEEELYAAKQAGQAEAFLADAREKGLRAAEAETEGARLYWAREADKAREKAAQIEAAGPVDKATAKMVSIRASEAAAAYKRALDRLASRERQARADIKAAALEAERQRAEEAEYIRSISRERLLATASETPAMREWRALQARRQAIEDERIAMEKLYAEMAEAVSQEPVTGPSARPIVVEQRKES